MEDARGDIPTGSGNQFVGRSKIGNAVIPPGKVHQGLLHLFPGGFGVQTEECVGKIPAMVVELRREVIGLGLTHLSHQCGMLVPMMDVVGEGALIVEELGKHGPLAIAVPEPLTYEIALEFINGIPEQDLFGFSAVFENDEAQSLVFTCIGTVVRRGGGGEPSLVDATSLASQSVIVVRMELDAPPRYTEYPGYPGRSQPQDAFPGVECVLND